ncbi:MULTISPECIES: endopeptidase La [Streptomyces]|jgi:ATP-dependent Lon protease|uniref:Lon protease n=1 Tax=Streptomyces mirabilis TaxID=68239 RepID=A0ABU3UKX2_9ACTN|nr:MULTISPECIES: endopeptidase La [Streptomyces]KPH99032.1 ATP-dependent protease La [Actinobacteria bacterium OK006]MCX5351939.1 endopeptidase La [Streptomyces mirabilis]MDU8994577.1 endopeptidase La [Streptomyces mirabilis]NMI60894.1 endopeptidase La [Streptomyces sp. RLA2-12]QDN60021.1 endopeptidase La [Streptomyces sp. S1D4-20]
MASTSTPLTLPVLPLDDEVVLPGMVVPLDLNDADVRAAVEAAQAAARSEPGKPKVLLVPRIDGAYPSTGVLGTVEQVGRLADGDPGALIRGRGRVKIGAGTTGPGAALWVEGTRVDETVPDPLPGHVAELVKEYKALATSWLRKRGAWQVVDRVQAIDDVSTLADNSGYSPFLSTEQKVTLLETADPVARLKLATEQLREHLAEQDVAESIAKDVQEGVDKQQREFLLRRQLEAVRKELRELNGDAKEGEESDDYRTRVEAADLPENVREAALKEVDKLERSSDQSPEGGWIRTWLDTVLELPWNERTEDEYDIQGAKSILDAEHAGLEDVKERITEYLAVRKRRSERGLGVVGGRRGGAVLALVGPPGVGKTSLGESVAHAMGRKFVRVALGGVRDEAEIRGHRRTYVGALPGRIVRAIKEAGSMNPVVLLDEIDKVGSDFRGDPAAALLEVLDPAQNHTFRDHYLEVELDLSDVVFLATANVLEAIPEALLDRMELVRLDGYTEDEKVVIARDHLLPRQLERAGLEKEEVALDESALRKLAGEYTREAGVRNLERAVARLLRKVAAQHELGERQLPFTVTDADLRGLIGRPHHVPESAQDPAERRTAVPGVATGLAVTGAGGDVLFVEASLADPETGAAGLTLTGQLGDVMKESAQIALSFLRSHGAELELPVGDLKDRGVHIHFPAGAVPKDGPSAGVTMTTALASLLSGRLVRTDVAMTGEVSLTGRVLPIGGVKQKLLAAHRAGVTTVIIPKRNEADLDDVPAEVLEKLDVHAVTDVRQVLELALSPAMNGATSEVPVAA